MVFGEFGPHGQFVAVIAKNQGLENVIVLLQQMEETLVQVLKKSQNLVQMVNVSLMVFGENGCNGQLVEPTVRSQEQEAS